MMQRNNNLYKKLNITKEDIPVAGRVVSISSENVVVDASLVWDDHSHKNQEEINISNNTAQTQLRQDLSNETVRAKGKEDDVLNKLSSHTSNLSNPHKVSKELIGYHSYNISSSAKSDSYGTTISLTDGFGNKSSIDLPSATSTQAGVISRADLNEIYQRLKLNTYTESNINNALASGFYPYCITGRPAGEDGWFTCFTLRSNDVDTNNYYTIFLIIQKRSDTSGKTYYRYVFKHNNDSSLDNYTQWIGLVDNAELDNKVTELLNKISTISKSSGTVSSINKRYPNANGDVSLSSMDLSDYHKDGGTSYITFKPDNMDGDNFSPVLDVELTDVYGHEVYSGDVNINLATEDKAGLMSSFDKSKLDLVINDRTEFNNDLLPKASETEDGIISKEDYIKLLSISALELRIAALENK